MTGFIFFIAAVLVASVTGLALHLLLRRSSHSPHQSVTRTEWVVGTIVATVLVVPMVTFIGGAIAKSDATTYYEYWSGLETAANVDVTTCTRDGSCVHTYDCDPYTVMVTKTRQVPYPSTESYKDANGNMSTRPVTKYRKEVYQEPETRYHRCPFVEEEYTFTVDDTLGETYTLGSHWFPENAEDARWSGTGYNDPRYGFGRPTLPSLPSGEPAKWVAAKARIDAEEPGGTTQRQKYDNYILASSEDIYEKFSSSIETYRSAGLLPKVQTEVYDEYRADKVYFVGDAPSDADAWQLEAQRLTGHLGDERQGDLHVVVVNDAAVEDLDDYTQALDAYWQSEALEKNTLSKNGLVVVVKLDSAGTAVEDSRGFTGMPMGNEALIQAFSNLDGTEATAEAILGKDGAIAALAFAEDNGYERVEMANYDYLADSIQIGTGARIGILAMAIFLSLLVWGVMFTVDLRFAFLENLKFTKSPKNEV